MLQIATAKIDTSNCVRIGHNVFYNTDDNPVLIGQMGEDGILALFDEPIGVQPFKSNHKVIPMGEIILAVARSATSVQALRTLSLTNLSFPLVSQE